MEISAKQKEFLDVMADPQVTELFIGGSGGGATVYGHPVKTPTGEIPIENVKIGDKICNLDGGVSRVIDIPWDGEIECYRITFVDGSWTEVSKNHLWKYKRASFPVNKKQEFRIGTTEQLVFDIERYKKNLLIPLTKPVVFRKEFGLKHHIDPYVLGVLLGDGSISLRDKNTVRLRICCPDVEIIERCRKRFSGKIRGPGKRGRDWELVFCKEEREAARELGLVGMKCNVKFIPERFKYGSIEERKEILRGLFDTDGWTDSRGHLQFSTTSVRMAKDVQFIVRSLGGNATLSFENRVGRKMRIDGREAHHNFVNYKVYVQHECKEWFLTLPKKLERVKPYNGGRGHLCKRIIRIEPVGVKRARCITTSAPDGLYLTDDFIVTHNSKSFCIGLLTALWAKQYPGVKFFIGRKTLKSLKQSTISTMLNKVFPALGLGYDEYRMHFQDMTLDFVNGSTVVFGELEYQPSDSEFNRYGSLEFDVAIIDEAGEVVKTAKDILRSRAGRGILAQKYQIPGKLLLAGNPSQGWLKTEYYDPWSKLEGGDYRRWQIGEVEVNGVKVPSYRAFMRMSAYDNPFLPPSYIDNLKALPDVLRKKLLDGDWNYADEDNMLFKAGLLEKATAYELPGLSEKFSKFVGVDVAAQGKDFSVYTLIENGVVITQKVSSVQMNWDKKSEAPLFRLMADELIEFAQRNGFTQKEANRIAIEGNGVGQALVSCVRERGWNVKEFTATAKSRSSNYRQLQLDFDAGDLRIYHDMSGREDLFKELAGHTYYVDGQEIVVDKKENIKKNIGRSPDRSDSLAIANWVRHEITDRKDPKYNERRIYF